VGQGEGIDDVLTGIGGIVTGAGAGFMLKQRAEAGREHRAALHRWQDYTAQQGAAASTV
jgi:hypothetical protein